MLHMMKNQQAIQQALPYLQHGDDLILLEDSVYCANPQHEYYPQLLQCGVQVYVLQEDIHARGLQSFMVEGVEIVDYPGFVCLTAKHPQLMTWKA